MKFRQSILVAGMMLALSGMAAAADAPAQKGEAREVQTLVTVNGKPVTSMHFAMFSAQSSRNNRGTIGDSPQQQVALLNELINTFMVADSEEGRAFAQREDIAAALEVSRIQMIAQGLIRDRMQNAPVDEAKVKEIYKERFSGIPGKEYKARHILLDTEADAVAVIESLDAGEDFAKLAKEKSTGPSGKDGGDLGWFTPGQMVKPFSTAVAAMETDKHSTAPVKTQFGWHVIKLEGVRDVAVPTLEEARGEIESELRQEAVAQLVADIRERADIEIEKDDPAAAASPKGN